MSEGKDDKAEKLFIEYVDFVSSTEESDAFLKQEGLDTEQLINEGVRKAKQVQMLLASQKTENAYKELKLNLLERAKQEVDKLLADVSFNIEDFLKRETLNVSFKNFEKLTQDEVREFLERHYLLKFEDESKNKKE